MIYLFATIALNATLFALFKLFPRFGIDGLQAIVVNYFVCVLTGSIFLGNFPITFESPHQSWFWWAVLMGVMFISIFNLIAWRTKEDGMTTTTIANKLSLVIPALFSVFLYGDQLTVLKVTGIVLAFPAVYLSTRTNTHTNKSKSLFYPALLFVGSGLLDTLVKFTEHHYLSTDAAQASFTVHIFAVAFIIGAAVVTLLVATGKRTLHWKNLLAGIILGVPNYFSIYYLIQFLHEHVLQSSAAIPVNNIGIVLASTLVAIIFFKEKLTLQRGIGLAFSLVAILFLALSDG
ncbi:MAG: EamA/RhaT family transporter [Bacteroidetes bacterium]|nr:EamA/RhaT family transporter [Bacteroidota bacterium]MBS1741244.1 EamA/RhaT family transporter [Bacteroidota bacterium]